MAITYAEAQTLVGSLAAEIAPEVERQMIVGAAVTRKLQAAVVAAGAALTINHTDKDGGALAANAADFTDFTATVPVARLNADADFRADLVRALAAKVAADIDGSVLNLYSGFSTHAPVGTGGSALTEALLKSAADTLDSVDIPAGDTRYLALKNTTEAWRAVRALAEILDGAKVGAATVQSIHLKNRAPLFWGLRLLVSNEVKATGSAPTTTQNFAFTRSSIALVTCRTALVNDATNAQAHSETGSLGVHVRLAFDGSDTQVVGFRVRGAALVARAAFGIQVRS